MGNIFGTRQTYDLPARPIPPHELWLQNQTFHVENKSYTLLDRRGGGGYASVWASVSSDGVHAAVKVFDLRTLKPGMNLSTLSKSFRKEVNMSLLMRGAINHVVSIYGFDVDLHTHHVALITMELGDDSLKERVQALHMMYPNYDGSKMIGDDYIPASDRKYIWVQLVDIILALHRYHVVHRDMKPDNLMFFGPTMKIVDLGIAHREVLGSNKQKFGGSRYYSAPECFTGQAPVTSKADIWSAGAVLYYLTYGQAPMYASSRPPPGVPQTRSPLVQDVLYRCLQRNPYKRASHRWLANHPLTMSPAMV